MSQASAGSIVDVAMGTYATTTTAEVFPIWLVSDTLLRGHGMGVTVIQCGEVTSALRSDGATVALEDITFGPGTYGAVAADNSSARFTRVSLDGCAWGIGAGGPGREVWAVDCEFSRGTTLTDNGGGIGFGDCTATVTGCTFEDNYGTAIAFSEATVTISETTLTGNGYGISGWASDATIEQCEIASTVRGDAVVAWDRSAVHVSDSTLTANLGDGVVVSDYSSLDVARSAVTSNAANGLLVGGYDATMTVESCEIRGNGTGLAATASYGYAALVDVAECTITANNLGGDGRGIYTQGAVDLTVRDSRVTAHTNTWGAAGVYLDQSVDATISGTLIEDNEAPKGAGICGPTYGSLALSSCALRSNVASGDALGGGALRCDASRLSLAGCVFKDNRSAPGGGGAVAHAGCESFEARNCTFTANVAGSFGGGMSVGMPETGTVLVDGCVFDSNTSAQAGGGASITGSRLTTVSASTFTSNTSDQGAGAMLAGYGGSLGDLTMHGNTGGDAGALQVLGDFAMERLRITSNDASSGPAVSLGGGEFGISNCIVAGNTGNVGTSGGIASMPGEAATITVSACTIADNDGGGIGRSDPSTATLTDCIVWGHDDDLGGCEATFSDIGDGDAGTGNISADPLFVDAAAGDYRLSEGSPCIDAGTDVGAPPEDFDRILRPQDGDGDGGAACDMGAHERPYFSLDHGARTTLTTTVTAYQIFAGALQVRYDTGSGYGSWLPVLASRSLTLPSGDGTKTVLAEFAYGGGLRTIVVSDSIILDSDGPPVIGGLASPTHPSEDSWYQGSNPQFTWESTGAVAYSWALDGPATALPDEVSDGTTPSASLSGVDDGESYFHVRAVDRFGTWSETVHRRVRIDATPPTGTATLADGAAFVNTLTVDAELDVTDITTVTIEWMLWLESPWSEPVTHTPGTLLSVLLGSEPPTQTVGFQLTDRAGNQSMLTDSIVVDLVPPAVTGLTSPTHPSESTYYPSGAPTFTWTADDPVSGIFGYSYVLDQSAGTTPDEVSEGPTSSAAYSGLADGVYYFHVRARDGANNWGPPAQRTVRIGAVPPSAEVTRVSGTSRYETALEISRANFGSAGTVVVATGADFPDALAAAGLCGSYQAPLLLTPRDWLAPGILGEIARLGATHVIIVGSDKAVSGPVEAALQSPGRTVERIYGADRISTAAEIGRRIVSHEGGGFVGEVFVARGDSFPDALAASPLAYARKMPTVLVWPRSLPQASEDVLEEMGTGVEAHVLGSSAAIDQSVVTALPVAGATRLEGPTRYGTAAVIAGHGCDNAWTSWGFVGIATGLNFPDALGGGIGAGELGGVLLLTTPTTLAPECGSALSANKADVLDVQVFGGPTAVTDGVLAAIEAELD